jgi:hypothetical protein
VLHDDQPPGVAITGGPWGTEGSPVEVFTSTGDDARAPPNMLQFAWSLDASAFSPFQAASPVQLTGLSDGPHTFRVKARDQTGNEDPTPAERVFTVSRLQIIITELLAGTTGPAGSLLVRGNFEAAGTEVGGNVTWVSAFAQGTTFAALIPVTQDTTTLTAVATTAPGAMTSHQVVLAVTSPPDSGLVLLASPQSGVAPLRVVFSLLGGPVPAPPGLRPEYTRLPIPGEAGSIHRGP